MIELLVALALPVGCAIAVYLDTRDHDRFTDEADEAIDITR